MATRQKKVKVPNVPNARSVDKQRFETLARQVGNTDQETVDRAWRAVQNFRANYLPLCQGFARSLTGNQKMQVFVTGGVPCTDGQNIYMRPPMALADVKAHDRHVCNLRDENDVLRCAACVQDEVILGTLLHEIAHIVMETFKGLTNEDVEATILAVLAEKAITDGEGSRAQKIRTRMEEYVKHGNNNSGMGLASVVNPFMPHLVNVLEDSRVNRGMFAVRKGAKRMFQNNARRILQDGLEQYDGTVTRWCDAPMEGQVTTALLLKTSGYDDLLEFLDPKVTEIFTDPVIRKIVMQARMADSAKSTYRLAYPFLERCREAFDLFKRADDEQDDPTQEDEDQPDVPKPEQGDDTEQDAEKQDSDEASEDEDDGEGAESEDGEEGPEGQPCEDGEPSDDGDEDGEGEGSDDSDEDGEGEGSDDSDEDGEGEGSDDSDEDGEGEGSDDSDEDGEGEGSGSGSGKGQDTDDEDGDPQVGGSSDLEDDDEDGDPWGPPSGDPSGDPSDDAPEDGDDEDGDEDGEGAGETPAEDQVDEGDLQAMMNTLGGHGGGSGGTDYSFDFEDVSPEEESAMQLAVSQDRDFDAPSVNVPGVRFHRANGEKHPHPRSSGRDLTEELFYGSQRLGNMRSWQGQNGVDTTYTPPEGIISASLMKARIIFAENRRTKYEPGKKAGRVVGRHLHRVPVGNPIVFSKKHVPNRHDYFVVMGIDASGSGTGYDGAIEQQKRAVMAMGDLLHRVGVKFVIVAHTGFYHDSQTFNTSDVDLLVIRDENDPWGEPQKERLRALVGGGTNVDGHTLEQYRKWCDRSNATDKIILYFTDGAMPATNYDEELMILQREIETCRKRGYALIGVGMGTDSPNEHGLDTIQIDSVEDIPNLIKELEKRITVVV